MADASAPPATRTSWKIHPCPAERAALKLVAAFSLAEFDRIKAGLIPLEMEDKWYQHSEVGRVFPEGLDAPRGAPQGAPKQGLWRRIRSRFR